jgi:hypothetical protein
MQLTSNRPGSDLDTPQYEGGVAFVAKWLNEYDVENRLEDDHIFLSFMMSL